MLLCLVAIELSDFVFAIDSIPAVIGVSQDVSQPPSIRYLPYAI